MRVIGGNKILLEADDTGVFFDFGIDYALWGQYFEEYLKPRRAAPDVQGDRS